MKYKLHKAAIDDFDFVFEVKKNALGRYIEQTWGWNEELQRIMQEDEFKSENIFIVKHKGQQVGTVGINEKNNEVIVARLYILDMYQTKGIGSQIMTDIISDNPDKKIRLGVLKVNSKAKELYERLGFKVIGEENEHYKMVYEKKLSP